MQPGRQVEPQISRNVRDQSRGDRVGDGVRPTPVHFGYLDGIRGVAAMYVVLHHFCLWGTNGLPKWTLILFGWTLFGHFAVAVFITLSGFCLMLPVCRNPDHELVGGFWTYIKRRAFRILPPYYAALFAAIVILALSPQGIDWLITGHRPHDSWWLSNFSLSDIFAHIFLIHNLSMSWFDKLDMAMWSIATEWQIYFFFPLLLLPVWRRFGGAAAIATGFVVGLLPHFLLPQTRNFDQACPWYLGLFALGMTTAATSLRVSWFDKNIRLLPWISLVLLALYFSTKFLEHGHGVVTSDSNEWIKDSIGGLLAASVIIYCAISSRTHRKSKVLSLLQARPIVSLGTWSYSLYLTHCLVLQEMIVIRFEFGLSPVTALLLRIFVGIPLALAFAYGFFLLCERPFLRIRNNPKLMTGGTATSAESARDAALSPAP